MKFDIGQIVTSKREYKYIDGLNRQRVIPKGKAFIIADALEYGDYGQDILYLLESLDKKVVVKLWNLDFDFLFG